MWHEFRRARIHEIKELEPEREANDIQTQAAAEWATIREARHEAQVPVALAHSAAAERAYRAFAQEGLRPRRPAKPAIAIMRRTASTPTVMGGDPALASSIARQEIATRLQSQTIHR